MRTNFDISSQNCFGYFSKSPLSWIKHTVILFCFCEFLFYSANQAENFAFTERRLQTSPVDIRLNYSNPIFTFTIVNKNKKIGPYFTDSLSVPLKTDIFQSFSFANSKTNTIVLIYDPEVRYIEIKFSTGCLFPVFAFQSGKDFSKIGIDENQNFFTISTDALGISGFNKISQISSFRLFKDITAPNSADTADLYHQIVDFRDQTGAFPSTATLYCPFFANESLPTFSFDILFKKRQNSNVVVLPNASNELASFSQTFLVPFAGSTILTIASLSQNTKFTFNSTTDQAQDVYLAFDFDGTHQSYRYSPPSIVLPAAQNVEITLMNNSTALAFILMQATSTTDNSVVVASKAGMIAGIVIGSVAFCVIAFLLFWFRKRIFFCWKKPIEEGPEIISGKEKSVPSENQPLSSYQEAVTILMARNQQQNLAANLADKDLMKMREDSKKTGNLPTTSTNLPSDNTGKPNSLDTRVASDNYPVLESEDRELVRDLESKIHSQPNPQPLTGQGQSSNTFNPQFKNDEDIPILQLNIQPQKEGPKSTPALNKEFNQAGISIQKIDPNDPIYKNIQSEPANPSQK